MTNIIINGNTIWHSGETHDLSQQTVQIAFGSTLTIEGGCTVTGGSIQAFGTLNVTGSAESAVTLNNVSIGYNGPDISHPGQVNITHANILGGYILYPTGNYVAGSINLIDSTITNLNGYIYLVYPLSDAHIEGNIFKNSGGITAAQGTSNSGEPYGSVFIKNNVFIGQTSGYAVENLGSYSGATVVENNSFLSTNLIALSLRSAYPRAAISAANNYFGTTDIAVINAMIYDKTDDLSVFSVISNSHTNFPSTVTLISNSTYTAQPNQTINGTSGVNKVVFSEPASNFTVSISGSTATLVDKVGTFGTEILNNVQRVQFNDGTALALDFQPGQNGHLTAIMIGTAFGAGLVSTYFAPGVSLYDAGQTNSTVAALIEQLGLIESQIGSTSNKAWVDFVYKNVVGVAPDPVSEATFVNDLNNGTYTKASLLALAAGVADSGGGTLATQIDLVGLQAHGLSYHPSLG